MDGCTLVGKGEQLAEGSGLRWGEATQHTHHLGIRWEEGARQCV